MIETKKNNISSGMRLKLRDEDFLVTHAVNEIINVEGISEFSYWLVSHQTKYIIVREMVVL
jgi:hypothetical protein